MTLTFTQLAAHLGDEQVGRVIAAALERQKLAALCEALGVADGASLSRHDMALALVHKAKAPSDSDTFIKLVAVMDEACDTERRLIASIDTHEVAAKLGAHGALRFRYHGAKLCWALLRETRSEVRASTQSLIDEYLTHSQELLEAHQTLESLDAKLQRELQEKDQLARKVQKLSKRLDVAEKDSGRLEALQKQVDELLVDNNKLKERMERLRDEHAKNQKSAAQALPKELSAPAVTSPRQHLRHKNPTGAQARVGVFLDVANLSGAARRLYQGAVDYKKLLTVVVGQRQRQVAHAYAIDKGEGNFESFARVLRSAGYQVSAKKPKVFPDGTWKADWDIGIAVDAVLASANLDVVVLGTGDGDFLPLVKAIKARGVRVELVSFSERTAVDLANSVDAHVELDAGVLTG